LSILKWKGIKIFNLWSNSLPDFCFVFEKFNNFCFQVIKQSQLVLSFLAMEGRLSNEHLDTIWAAAQLKHCSRQVHDLLPPLIKHLEARPVLHLYRLLCRLEPKEHTEQSLFLASALIKFIWSSSSSEALLKALPAQRRPQSSSENSVSMDGSEEEESEDGRKTPSTASEEAKRPSTDSSTASSMRPGSRRGMMLPQRPQKAPSESDDDKKMVTDFMMVEDDEEDEEHSQVIYFFNHLFLRSAKTFINKTIYTNMI
jgi:hypothetical protein